MTKRLLIIALFFLTNTYSQSAKKADSDKKVYEPSALTTMPAYPGGLNKLYQLLKKEVRIPKEIVAEDTHSFVAVKFVIEKDGTMSNFKVLRDAGFGSGKEVIRVLKQAKKWSSGKINGKKVRCSYMLPVHLLALR